MRGTQVNIFSKLNLDSSKQSEEHSTSAINLENFRLDTLNGLTIGSLTNIKGNSLLQSIPDATFSYKVSISGTGTTNITIANQTGAGITITNDSTIQDVYNYIIGDSSYTKCKQNINFSTSTEDYDVFVNNEYIVIIGNVADQTNAITPNLSMTSPLVATSYISAQTNLQPIGYTVVRNTIYLYTTNDTSSTGSYGQIWEVAYNPVSLIISDFILRYNGAINFTTQYPISDVQNVGVYENSNTIRLYWTDNFNPLRTINIADPNAFAILPGDLVFNPPLTKSIPILEKIIQAGGPIEIGVYQFAYRLKTKSGKLSTFSDLSNLIYINQYNEDTAIGGANFKDYIGSDVGTTTNKSIKCYIPELDLSYDNIEVILIYRRSKDGSPEIYKFVDQPINDWTNYEFTFGGLTGVTAVSLEEVLIDNNVIFTHCKTIASKDNRLLAGNVRYTKTDLNWDARAYSFPSLTGNVDIYDGQGNFKTVYAGNGYRDASTGGNLISDTYDAINNNYTINRYKAASNKLGGSGINVSYEFGTYAIKADSVIATSSSQIGTGASYRHPNPNYNVNIINLGISGQDYQMNGINDGMKYPYRSGLLKGYKRNEYYRFGIQFYDRQGNKTFCKWIADIQIPDYSDVCSNPDAISTLAGINDFRLTFDYNNEQYLQIPYVKFTVDTTSISSLISGYEIVRTERLEADRTILTQGLVYSCSAQRNAGIGSPPWSVDTVYTQTENDTGNYQFIQNATSSDEYTRQVFVSPEMKAGFINPSLGGKSIYAHSFLQSTTTNEVPPGGSYIYIHKMYINTALASAVDNIEDVLYIGAGEYQDNTFSSSIRIGNYSRASTENVSASIGNSNTVLKVTSGTWGANTAGFHNAGAYIADITQSNPNQYGGKTYAARAVNEYISCQNFQPNVTGQTSYTSSVFGGDTYMTIFDWQIKIKNFGATTVRGQSVTNRANVIVYFPVESSVNTELRQGYSTNKDLSTDSNEVQDEFRYNTVYSAENNIITYIPKPLYLIDNTVFDVRTHISEVKTSGELIDSWTRFKADNYWDVEAIYGPLNSLVAFQDRIFYHQDKCFGILAVNPRVLITDQNDDSLQLANTSQLGSGNIIQRHDNISNQVGCGHQWSIIQSPDSLFWFDKNYKKIYKYSQNGLEAISETKKIQSYLKTNINGQLLVTDNPIYDQVTGTPYGISATYDNKYNEARFTFKDYNTNTAELKQFTLVFNEKWDIFSGFYTSYPKIYINDDKHIITNDPSTPNNLFLEDIGDYCKFYNTVYPNKLSFIINKNFDLIKIFENLVLYTEAMDIVNNNKIYIYDDCFDRIRVYNDHQNTDTQTLTLGTNIERIERKYQIQVPRNRVLYSTTKNANIFTDLSTTDKDFAERIRDKYCIVDLEYDNTNNYNFIVNNVESYFRASSR